MTNFFNAGRFREAVPELQRARQNPHARLKAMNVLGCCYGELGMLDLAMKQLEEASREIVSMDEMKKEIVYNLGLIYERMGDPEKSLACMKQIYEVDYGYRDVARRVESSYERNISESSALSAVKPETGSVILSRPTSRRAFDWYLRLGCPRHVQPNKAMKTKIRIVSQLYFLALVIGAMSLAGAARAADTTPTGEGSSLSEKDKTFMKKAAKGGMMEVAMGKVAEQNAQSDDVKSFGKRMVTDHSKANDELKSIASKKGFNSRAKSTASNGLQTRLTWT